MARFFCDFHHLVWKPARLTIFSQQVRGRTLLLPRGIQSCSVQPIPRGESGSSPAREFLSYGRVAISYDTNRQPTFWFCSLDSFARRLASSTVRAGLLSCRVSPTSNLRRIPVWDFPAHLILVVFGTSVWSPQNHWGICARQGCEPCLDE